MMAVENSEGSMCYHHFDNRRDPMTEFGFSDPMYQAQYVGSSKRGGHDPGWYSRPWYRHRNDEIGGLVEGRDGDYILVTWDRGPEPQRSLYILRAGADPEYICEVPSAPYDVEDAVELHFDRNRALGLIAMRKRAEAAEAERRRLRMRRSDVRCELGELPKGAYFRTPRGELGRVAGVTEKFVSWRFIGTLPDGAEAVTLQDQPW